MASQLQETLSPRWRARRRGRMGAGLVCAVTLVLVAAATGLASQDVDTVRILIETDLGEIEVELEAAKAPVTTENFLRYVDAGHFDGGRFHRAVRLDNQNRSDVLIEVVQGSVNPEFNRQGFGAIELERTRDTGLKHVDGAISLGRSGPDTATSSFFICINDQPSLDFGGDRNADGQGFSAFGKVVRGMDVVRRIQESPTESENLTPPIAITRVSRAQ